MLRSMLAERFRLVLHIESRNRSVWVLSVRDADRIKSRLAQVPPGPQPMWMTERGDFMNKVRFRNFSLRTFAILLARQLDLIVVDETGTEGEFDFEYNAPRSDDGNPKFASRLDATLSELGLRLESRRQPTAVYTVTSVQHPTEN